MISFRVSDALKAELEGRAGPGGISKYLLGLIEQDGHQQDRFEHILELLEDSRGERGDAGEGIGADPAMLGLLVELLLLMRSAVKPEAQREAQREVQRLGLDVWGVESLRSEG